MHLRRYELHQSVGCPLISWCEVFVKSRISRWEVVLASLRCRWDVLWLNLSVGGKYLRSQRDVFVQSVGGVLCSLWEVFFTVGWKHLSVGGTYLSVGGRYAAVGGKYLAVGGMYLAVGGKYLAVGGKYCQSAVGSES